MSETGNNSEGISSHVHEKHDEEERLEREHFMNVIRSFKAYRSCSLSKLEKRVKDLMSIPLWHRKLVPDYAKRLKESKSCIDENQKLILSIIGFADGMFRNADFDVSGKPSSFIYLLR